MNNAVIADRIKSICKVKKISISQVLNECELTKSFVYDLEKRNTSPSCEKIYKIAEYLDCSVDYLLGRTDAFALQSKAELKEGNKFCQNFNGNVTYEGNVNNATADNIVINSNSPIQSENSEEDSEYADIIQYLDNLERKRRLHALVDIRCLLEEDYKIKKK